MVMHAPVPLARLRPASSTSLSSGVGCRSCRWHSIECAVSTETYSKVQPLRNNSEDSAWRAKSDLLRKLNHERSDNYYENRKDARMYWELDKPDEHAVMAACGIRDNVSHFLDLKPTKLQDLDQGISPPSAADFDCPGQHASGRIAIGQHIEQTWSTADEIAVAIEHENRVKHSAGASGKATSLDTATDVDLASSSLSGDEYASQVNEEVLLKNLESEKSLSDGALQCASNLGTLATGTSPLPKPIKVECKVARLVCAIEDVLVVDNMAAAMHIVDKLRGEYKDLVHACDTEVSDIDVKKESPVGHGKVICFSIYCGPNADFGNGKSCVWVDTLDLNKDVLNVFKDYFEDSSIKKVWHNFSFDKHVLANHGIRVAGFLADTMHLARLWHSGRKGTEGSYSLESLTSDINVMSGVHQYDAQTITKKISMMELFGSRKLKKDGTEGCTKVIPPVEELQRSESTREKWICYSSGDALCTWRLWESLHKQLGEREWYFLKEHSGSMYDFYDRYWRPFGELLAEMERHGMLVDRDYLAEIEKVAFKERATSISRFRKWAAKYCPYAQYINVTSDAQIRQLLYGGFKKVSKCRSFRVPNIDGYIEEGKKAPLKFRTVELCGIGVKLPWDILTSSGQPAVSMQALKNLAGKVSVDCSGVEDEEDFIPGEADTVLTSAGLEVLKESEEQKKEDLSAYGQAYHAFNGGQEGREACKAIAALCEVSAIDTLISGFIQPLQGGDIMGPDNRVHCSLNLNTETGRLSARRPNLQNQPALEKDRYKIRQAFIASPGNSLIVADYGQLELRLLAHLADCASMLKAFKVGGDFHSRTAMNMYSNVKEAVEKGEVLLEWEPKPGEDSPPSPLLKDVYGSERRKAKMLNFSIAYGKTAKGLAKDWKVTPQEAQKTVNLWYKDRPEVRKWQEAQKMNARQNQCVYTLLGRPRHFPDVSEASEFLKGRVDRAAINTPVQGSAADVAMLAMLEIERNSELKQLGWKLLLQVHDEMILEGPTESAAYAKELVVKAMSHPFDGKNILKVDLVVDAKYASSWYAAK